VVSNLNDVSQYTCMKKLDAEGKLCQQETIFGKIGSFCNPGQIAHHIPCEGRAVCLSNQKERFCAPVHTSSTASLCGKGNTVEFCPIGLSQCRSTKNGERICALDPNVCEEHGGVIYSARACGSCHHVVFNDGSSPGSPTTTETPTESKYIDVDGSGRTNQTVTNPEGELPIDIVLKSNVVNWIALGTLVFFLISCGYMIRKSRLRISPSASNHEFEALSLVEQGEPNKSDQ
jgi:hypothetical protein